MLWFEGSIPDAIARAKQSSAVFVVFVSGDDEQSTQMAESWNNEDVANTATEGFVAIKIDSKSETCLQFSQIYPVVCIPSSFFIGDNGVPLEVIAGSVSTEELTKRIQNVKKMHSVKNEVLIGNDSQSANHASKSSPVQQNHPESTNQSTPCETMEDLSGTHLNRLSPSAVGDAAQGNPCGTTEELTTDGQSTDISVKVERINKKLEERREQKQKAEEQVLNCRGLNESSPTEIKKEIERRKTGKEVLEFKRRHEDDLAKRLLEERTKEKAEEKAARERIMQQIALDRADRAARFAKTKEEIEAVKAAALQARQEEMEAKRNTVVKERSAVTRIQFRLPDGSSFTNQFPSESPLEEARQFAAQAGRPSTAVVQSSGGSLWTFFGTILYPLIAVWRFFTNFLLSSPPPSQAPTRATYEQERSNSSTSNAAEPKREAVRKRVLEKSGEEFKKEGKVYRLKTQDDEDENNTWNGNSTQQM